MAKSWLDVQVDLELAQSKPGLTERFKSCIDESPETMQNGFQASLGPEDWPLHVLNQQPRDLPALLQKLHSGYACYYWEIFHFVLPVKSYNPTYCFVPGVGKWCTKLLSEHAKSNTGRFRYFNSQRFVRQAIRTIYYMHSHP